MSLTNAEEQLMQILWTLKKAYMKDLLEAHDTPKPATTTVATLLKRMIDKNYVGYETHGNSRQYYTKISRNQYFAQHMNTIIYNFFDNSPSQFASFFATSTKLTEAELIELRKIIDQQLDNK